MKEVSEKHEDGWKWYCTLVCGWVEVSAVVLFSSFWVRKLNENLIKSWANAEWKRKYFCWEFFRLKIAQHFKAALSWTFLFRPIYDRNILMSVLKKFCHHYRQAGELVGCKTSISLFVENVMKFNENGFRSFHFCSPAKCHSTIV